SSGYDTRYSDEESPGKKSKSFKIGWRNFMQRIKKWGILLLVLLLVLAVIIALLTVMSFMIPLIILLFFIWIFMFNRKK
ncbi:MAG: hypothetical protein LBR68_07415, partial [Lachnoclostridium sp.]|nr:hypothetical protein [Lachnoclostridium sp.]